MKLLFFDFGSYTAEDIIDVFRRNHIEYKIISYQFKDKNADFFFEERFSFYLTEYSCDAVFSINYFPLIATACHKYNIKYLSWCYDTPFPVTNPELTLSLATNYIFFFEYSEYNYYKEKGFDTVYHLPLATNIHRLSNIKITTSDREKYSSDISFIGQLYPNKIDFLLDSLKDYEKGYLNSIMDIQLNLYGRYIIDELLTKDLLFKINTQHPHAPLSKEQISYTMATNITRTERLLILGLLSHYHQVALYSTENLELLNKALFKGSANYLGEMPKIFKCSKINLNITHKITKTGIPLRIMDILGSGGLLLTNYQDELMDYFVNEEDIIIYENIEDSLEKATFLLKNETIRLKIAANGFEKVRKLFSYENQFVTLFKIAGLID